MYIIINETMNTIRKLEAIHGLIEGDMLFVDYRTPRIILSYPLYHAFMDDELKKMKPWYRLFRRMGWLKDDYRLVNLIKNIRLYIHMIRSAERMEPLEDETPVEFQVASMDKKEILLVGWQKGDQVEYR